MTNEVTSTNYSWQLGELNLGELNLPMNIEDMTSGQLEDFMAATGMGTQVSIGNNLPTLAVQHDADVEIDGKVYSLPRGSFRIGIKNKDDDKFTTGYAKTAEIRPYFKTNRYSVYDLDTNKMKLESLHFLDWESIILDTLGNEHRAKMFKKNTLEMYPQWKDNPKCKLVCSNIVYGTVSMEGVKDINDNKMDDVVDLPCVWITKGASFMAIANAFQEMSELRSAPQLRTLKLSTTRKKNGQVTYFPVSVEWQKPSPGANMDLIVEFGKTIAEENKVIVSDFKRVKVSGSNDDLAKQVFGGDLSSDFDLDDEIPL